jgi:hypothetical protein
LATKGTKGAKGEEAAFAPFVLFVPFVAVPICLGWDGTVNFSGAEFDGGEPW